jgi:hypothetical protein
MEIELYIDNFRGFSQTFIPICDVNFFVGENSTGKTSLLSLISLLGSNDFIYFQKFNNKEIHLGSFKDICSCSKRDPIPTFSIGYITSDNNKNFEAILMTYQETDNNPELCKINYYNNQRGFCVVLGNGPAKRKLNNYDSYISTFDDVKSIFLGWINSQDNITDFESLDQIKEFHNNSFLFFYEFFWNDKNKKFGIFDDISINLIRKNPFSEVIWIAPIRSKPKRTYDEYKLDFDSEGEHTPYMIRKLLYQKDKSDIFNEFIRSFGKESGLFEGLSAKGYGKELTSPFELRIELNNHTLSLINVGYGVSQALPIIIELFTNPKGTSYAIQQPEVHLHPKAQAALGKMIYRMAHEERKKFYIETHSDFTIDRFRLNLREGISEPNISSQVLFFSRNKKGNNVHSIKIQKDGSFSNNQPQEFREFFLNESLNMLGL